MTDLDRRIRNLVNLPVAARRGYRFARQIDSESLGDSDAPGRLESYFDAHTEGPGIWKWRHYFPIYERHLSKFVDQAPVIVEIGIFGGGSLAMWQHYFGEGTHVHGIDIEPACDAYADRDVSVWIGDQSDPAFWERFLAEVPWFDVVIDDGGHDAGQQIPTLEALLPRLRPGGVYLCEDVHGPGHGFHAYVDGLARNLHTVGPPTADRGEGQQPTGFQRSVESVHLYPFVTVIEKRGTRIDRLVAPRRGTRWEPFHEAGPLPTAPGADTGTT